jgi:Lon protease-like protein
MPRTWNEPVSKCEPMSDAAVEWWADAPDDAQGVALDAARRLARDVYDLRMKLSQQP